jgi:AAA family ATP:ADP antiporter
LTKVTQSALDYSLNNTVRNALFLPLRSEEKYKSKQVVDTISVRAGDVLAAGLVFLGSGLLDLSISIFALVNVVVVAIWLLIAVRLGIAYEKRATAPNPSG